MCRLSRNSGSLGLLEPEEPVQACKGIVLTSYFYIFIGDYALLKLYWYVEINFLSCDNYMSMSSQHQKWRRMYNNKYFQLFTSLLLYSSNDCQAARRWWLQATLSAVGRGEEYHQTSIRLCTVVADPEAEIQRYLSWRNDLIRDSVYFYVDFCVGGNCRTAPFTDILD